MDVRYYRGRPDGKPHAAYASYFTSLPLTKQVISMCSLLWTDREDVVDVTTARPDGLCLLCAKQVELRNAYANSMAEEYARSVTGDRS